MDELISKKAVIEAIEKARANVGHNLERSIGKSIIEILDDVGRDVDRLSSAEPKTGKWVDDGDPLMLKCSNCGYGVMRYNRTPFCPNCGEKKEVERDG